jgi:hypothetical protein
MRKVQALLPTLLLFAGLAASADARPRVALTAQPQAGGAVQVRLVAKTALRGTLTVGTKRAAAVRLRKGKRRTIRLSAARLRTLRAGCTLRLRLVARGKVVRVARVRRMCSSGTTAPGGIGSPPAAARAPAPPPPPSAPAPLPPEAPVAGPQPAPAGPKLHWAPPTLTNPATIELGTGYTLTRMDPARDYVVELPAARKVGATVLDGGRNVVVVGGHVTIPAETTDGSSHRAIYVKNATGTVHLEGIEIDGSGGGESDAIAISAPRATVQIENVRATGIRGGHSTWHADVIQPWGGVRELRVDGLTASSNYQGLQLNRSGGPIGSVSLRRVDLSQEPGPYDLGGFMLWLTNGSACDGYPVSLDQVYLAPRAGRTVEHSVWPEDAACLATLPITGEVTPGTPPDGSFVPAGTAGPAYRSPGYR